jgi:hypothetical protein
MERRLDVFFCDARRTTLGAILGSALLATPAVAREDPQRRNRAQEIERDIQNLSALIEAQQAEIAKLRQALGLNPREGRSASPSRKSGGGGLGQRTV